MTVYRICLQGHLDRGREAMFGGFTITHQVTPQQQPVTILVGPVADQSALYGLLGRFRNLGLSLISLQIQEADGTSSLPDDRGLG